MRAVLQLARSEDKRPIPIRVLAEREGISAEFLEQIFFRLRKNGIITSTRGPGGGFRLEKLPEELSLLEIFNAVDEGLYLSPCTQDNDCCGREEDCSVHGLWKNTHALLENYFNAISIQDILSDHFPRTDF